MNPVAILAVFFGAVICFFGFPIIHSAIRLWGFVVGGAVAVLIASALLHMPVSFTQLSVQLGIIFAVGGIIGLVLAGPLQIVIIFISGMALGGLFGMYVVPLLTRTPEITLITIILALVTGFLSVRFQEVVLIVTTSFAGSLMVIYGVRALAATDAIWIVIIFFLTGFFGAAAQYKSLHPESSLLRF